MSKCGLDECDSYGGCLYGCDYGKEKRMTNTTDRSREAITHQHTGSDHTYPMPADGWVCFHCGERFTKYGTALLHFGATPISTAACCLRLVTQDEKAILMELRRTQELLAKSNAARADMAVEIQRGLDNSVSCLCAVSGDARVRRDVVSAIIRAAGGKEHTTEEQAHEG